MFGGKVEVEDVRARMDVLKRGSEVNAERIVGPRWPPAPMMITFLMREEDILDEICYLDREVLGRGGSDSGSFDYSSEHYCIVLILFYFSDTDTAWFSDLLYWDVLDMVRTTDCVCWPLGITLS